jgi:hypothetical protein
MTSATVTPRPGLSPAAKAILIGGLLGGAGDFFFAFFFYGWRIRIFQTVAAGLIGREAAFAGGVPTFLLGVALHFLIGLIWAALFWALSRRAPALIKHAIPAGLGFGFMVYCGMNSVVLPLSALHTKAWPFAWAPWPIACHLFLVGLPIALVARHYARPPAAAT